MPDPQTSDWHGERGPECQYGCTCGKAEAMAQTDYEALAKRLDELANGLMQQRVFPFATPMLTEAATALRSLVQEVATVRELNDLIRASEMRGWEQIDALRSRPALNGKEKQK